ncbi:MAG TPA: hypothetical protein VJ978_12365 [Nitriliruptoraceae bacterium]|nr:hypothetical protein [Nitriliruptoraceae bacterium]
MYKVTDIIERPRSGSAADLPLAELVECLQAMEVAERIEVAWPLEGPGLPEPDHAMVLEAWFVDLERAQSLPQQDGFDRLDELASQIHQAAGIRRYFSEVA